MVDELTALVIDDEPQILGLLAIALDHEGFRTERVSTTAEGIEKLANRHYTIVLTDLNQTPTGVEVYNLAKSKGMRAYIITEGASTELMGSAREAAGQDIIGKPFRPSDIVCITRRIKQELLQS